MVRKKRSKKKDNLANKISKQVFSSPEPRPQIEVIQQPDTIDDDIGAYLSAFMKDFSELEPLENISLLSPEDAQAALATLTRTQEMLQNHMKTAQALKRMLKSS